MTQYLPVKRLCYDLIHHATDLTGDLCSLGERFMAL